MDKEKIGAAILDVLRKIIDSIHLPTGKILLPTLGFSIAITVISTIVSLVNGAAFVRPLGG